MKNTEPPATKIEILIIRYLTKQFIEKLLKKRDEFNFREIVIKMKYSLSHAHSKEIKKMDDKFDYVVLHYYGQIKNVLINKMKRIEKNKELLRLQKEFPHKDIISSFKYLVLKERMELKKTDIEIFETNLRLTEKMEQIQ